MCLCQKLGLPVVLEKQRILQTEVSYTVVFQASHIKLVENILPQMLRTIAPKPVLLRKYRARCESNNGLNCARGDLDVVRQDVLSSQSLVSRVLAFAMFRHCGP
eukprot:6492799-Amphidinium_carterae.12